MKTVVAICCAVALFQVSVEAQSWMPSMPSVVPSFGNYGRIFSAMTTIHSTLSNTPLKPFLPSPARMAMDIVRLASTAKNVHDAVQKANEHMTSVIQQAASAARMPMVDFSQLTSQMQSTLSNAMNVGSAPPPPPAQSQQ